MPIRFFSNLTLKYWHLNINILVIFNLLPFIFVIIELDSWTVISGHDSICVWATVPDFCMHICTCNTLILAVYEFAGGASDICKWSYICNTFCWIIETVNCFLFSATYPQAWVLMWLLFPANLVLCSVSIHLQDYCVAPNVELLCLALIFFDEIVKLQNVAPLLFKGLFNLK